MLQTASHATKKSGTSSPASFMTFCSVVYTSPPSCTVVPAMSQTSSGSDRLLHTDPLRRGSKCFPRVQTFEMLNAYKPSTACPTRGRFVQGLRHKCFARNVSNNPNTILVRRGCPERQRSLQHGASSSPVSAAHEYLHSPGQLYRY